MDRPASISYPSVQLRACGDNEAINQAYGKSYSLFTALIFTLAFVIACLALAFCAYVIVGFYENDPQFRAFWPAIILSLGVGAMAFIPASIVCFASAGRLK